MVKSPVLSIVIPVFNALPQLNEILSVLQVQVTSHFSFEIIVVDDASTIPVEISPVHKAELSVILIRNEMNQGRGNTRNKGAERSNGHHILFLDADCLPAKGFLRSAFEHIDGNHPLVFGHISFSADPFFEYYENNVQKKRAGNLGQWQLNMTTACVLISRDIFEEVGGYSSRFSKYGMEDRDFLLRIYERFSALDVVYDYGMGVIHKGEISLTRYVDKFVECGKYSLPIFRDNHPRVYRQMNYAIFDYVYNPWLRWIPKPVMKLSTNFLLGVLMACNQRWTNFRLKTWALKSMKGLALLKGSIASTD